jgi:hypothetical protein
LNFLQNQNTGDEPEGKAEAKSGSSTRQPNMNTLEAEDFADFSSAQKTELLQKNAPPASKQSQQQPQQRSQKLLPKRYKPDELDIIQGTMNKVQPKCPSRFLQELSDADLLRMLGAKVNGAEGSNYK